MHYTAPAYDHGESVHPDQVRFLPLLLAVSFTSSNKAMIFSPHCKLQVHDTAVARIPIPIPNQLAPKVHLRASLAEKKSRRRVPQNLPHNSHTCGSIPPPLLQRRRTLPARQCPRPRTRCCRRRSRRHRLFSRVQSPLFRRTEKDE